jgi:hypothetical protein
VPEGTRVFFACSFGVGPRQAYETEGILLDIRLEMLLKQPISHPKSARIAIMGLLRPI